MRALRVVLVVVLAGTAFSHAAFRYVDGVIGAIVAAALVWFAPGPPDGDRFTSRRCSPDVSGLPYPVGRVSWPSVNAL